MSRTLLGIGAVLLSVILPSLARAAAPPPPPSLDLQAAANTNGPWSSSGAEVERNTNGAIKWTSQNTRVCRVISPLLNGLFPLNMSATSVGPIVTNPTSFTVTCLGTNGVYVTKTVQFRTPPIVSSFSPAQEAVGAVVMVSGLNFTGASAVKFNGVSASFTVNNNTSLRATVPAGATTGPIRVESPGGAGVSASAFRVNPLCNPSIDIPRELAIKDLSVVNDSRTKFNPANLAGSHWSFGYLMGRMAGVDPADPLFARKTSNFVKLWLNQFVVVTSVKNGAPVRPRFSINSAVVNAWPRVARTDDLDMTKAPMRLLAIVNRLDLRNKRQAGEGRFVFGVLDSGGSSLPFTVILEYRLPLTATLTQNAWALKWHSLADQRLGLVGTTVFKAALQRVTDSFSSDAVSGLVNGSPINQVRTNEIALEPPWELREFRLNDASGQLGQVTVKQTPDFALDNKPDLEKWVLENQDAILAGTHVVPDLFPGTSTPFLGGTAPMPSGFSWLTNSPSVPPDVRAQFSLNTCNGCHSGDTRTNFLHVNPRKSESETEFSEFMKADLVERAMGPNGMRKLIIDLNCN